MKKLLIILFLLSLYSGFSQQDAQYTQYMYNTANINPAYAGSRGVLSVFGLHRTQWVGIDGAPVTNAFSINSPISNSNVGIGLSFVNDKIGPMDENAISVDVSYTISTSTNYKLSFGIKATADLLNVDFTRLNIYDPGDELSQYNIENKFSPNVGAGIYYHSDKTYFGLSVPNFLETKHFDKGQYNYSSNSVATEKMHLYFITGHVFDLSPSVKLKPAMLTKVVKGAPLQVDLSANVMFNEKFVIGAAYRWSAAGSLMAGFQINSKWFAGYGYDMEVTNLADYNSGSHEIFLRYELIKKYDKIISPRFF